MKLLLLPVLMFSFAAHAEDANKTETNVKIKKEKKTDKADQAITNRRFRASNGSLSDFSLNASLSYNGGSLDKPFAADRPNIIGAGNQAFVSGVAGTLRGSYRLNALNRLSAGAGVQMLAPFNDTIDTDSASAKKQFDENQGNLDVNNPFINYSYMNKFFGVQTILAAGFTQYTAGNFVKGGYDQAIDVSINTMYDFGGSPLSIGMLAVGTRNLFDKDDAALLSSQNETVFGFLPQAEYVINDTFNLRTIVRSNWYQNNRAERRTKYFSRPVTQSVGLGISVNRDIFLYPNIQFAWENAQASNTNVGFTANINMF
tara:strand:+ start:7332 stop:8276 length:945 start_codon:yes stop_codon:yes gene_type:complete